MKTSPDGGNSGGSVFDWKTHQDELAVLWSQGKSAGEIKALFEQRGYGTTSRNSIVGRIHRTLPKRDEQALHADRRDRGVWAGNQWTKERKARASQPRPKRAAPPRERSADNPEPTMESSNVIKFIDRQRWQCAAIGGKPTWDAPVCGKRCVDGLSWCPDHAGKFLVVGRVGISRFNP